ncbi:hypothetical protein [Phyllobacterium phragmitis]|nr:hypothetical protein [Phyllobacterium phragmitis]
MVAREISSKVKYYQNRAESLLLAIYALPGWHFIGQRRISSAV